jgi:GNAT superfamily N-acetyltransferase
MVPADATELADTATTALALARMVAADPGSAPGAVASLLRARLVDPAGSGPGHTYTLRIGTQQLRLGRAWPFSATEISRAAALLELAAQLELRTARPPAAERIVLLRDGSEVQMRRAEPSDGPLVAALHARCSPASRRARFLSPTPQLPPAELAELLGGDEPGAGTAVLAVTTDGGSAVGVATLAPQHADTARCALLVEDAWQGRGLGTALLRRAADAAVEQGALELVGTARPDELGLARLLRRAGLRPSAELVDGAVRLRAPLPTPVG